MPHSRASLPYALCIQLKQTHTITQQPASAHTPSSAIGMRIHSIEHTQSEHALSRELVSRLNYVTSMEHVEYGVCVYVDWRAVVAHGNIPFVYTVYSVLA